jgi:GTPase SAR1 family protein
MSCFNTSEESKKNKEISKKLQDFKKEEKKEIKLLLLGTGGCGKSTFFKVNHYLFNKL